MKVNLTSPSDNAGDLQFVDNLNENDPHQLRRIIDQLIKKSKVIISTLESTVARLEKMEGQRDYWKNSYLRFKDICQKYIDSEGIQHFQHLTDLQAELKKLQIQKSCLIEESRTREHPRLSPDRLPNSTSLSKNSIEQTKDFKSGQIRKKMQRLISTVSYTKLSPHSEHQIHPKTIKIFTQSHHRQSKQL